MQEVEGLLTYSPIRRENMLNQKSSTMMHESLTDAQQVMLSRRLDSSLDCVNQGDVVLHNN